MRCEPFEFVGLLVIACLAGTVRADAGCAGIDNHAERLRCYDQAYRRPSAEPATAVSTNDGGNAAAKLSLWEERILKDAERETLTLTAFRPSYIIYTHLSSANRGPPRVIDPAGHVSEQELKIQLSLQTKAVNDVFSSNGDLWLAYTQVAYWQAFNRAISSLFRESDYEPEAFFSFLTDYQLFSLTGRAINIGVVHQSNGQARPLSRSWNRVFAEFFFLRGDLVVSIKPWIRIKEDVEDDDNPRIEDYLGHYELNAAYQRNNHIYRLMLRNVFDRHHRYNAQLSWSFPIAGRLRGLVQWYRGYGENLIDHDFRNNRIGIGILMSDWL
jgi:phospholipase A1